MRRQMWGGLSLAGVLVGCSWALAQEAETRHSGPGPDTGIASKQYTVTLFQRGVVQDGAFTFARSTQSPPGTDPDAELPDDNDDDAGTDMNGTGANPVANGDFGTVGNPTGAPGNVTGNTSGSMNTNGTNTGTNAGAGMNTDTNPGTTTTPGPGGTNDPPSYWTRARANGQVASQTNDPASSDYWTRARANGEGGPGAGGGGPGTDPDGSPATSGEFSAELSDRIAAGTWYAYDLGSFSLWMATTESSDGNLLLIGYATPETIAGRAITGENGSFFESLFTSGVFYGTATAETPEEPAPDDSLAENE